MSATVRSIQYALNDDEAAYEAVKAEATVDGRVSAKKIGEVFERINAAASPNS